MKLWRCVWFEGELASVEIKDIPDSVREMARKASLSPEAFARVVTKCIDDQDHKGRAHGHACFVLADSVEDAIVVARTNHPDWRPQ